MSLVYGVRAVPAPQHSVPALARWAAQHCPPGGRVLEVGAGAHANGGIEPLLRRHARVVGVDPDPAVECNPDLTEAHRLRVEEYAVDHRGDFDVVFSAFVLEHVDDPPAFARACADVLRPGGSWFAVTPNLWHYFGATTWALSRLGIEGRVADRLLPPHDHDHRFRTAYRFNSPRAVRRYCEHAGFTELELRCYEPVERLQWYFPQPLKWWPGVYARTVRTVGRPGALGMLSFRARMPHP